MRSAILGTVLTVAAGLAVTAGPGCGTASGQTKVTSTVVFTLAH